MSYEPIGDTASDRTGGFHYTHSHLPYRDKPIPRSQITTMKQAQDYAAAGFHVSVTQANREPEGSNHNIAWQAAADDYYKAYNAGQLALVLNKLATADRNAASAPHVTRTAPPKDPAKPPVTGINPNSSVPVPEQILEQSPPGLMELQIGGFPLWAGLLGIGVLVIGPRLMKKGRKGRRRR
jgi:hypothetical protein